MPEISSTSPKLKEYQICSFQSNHRSFQSTWLNLKRHADTNRLIGMVDRAISSAVSVSYIAFENFVLMIPGATQLTRIFSVARSWLKAFVSPSRAVLLTE